MTVHAVLFLSAVVLIPFLEFWLGLWLTAKKEVNE